MGNDWQMQELTDRETIRQYLNTDRLYAAYAIGDLEPSLFPYCRWWLAQDLEVPRVGLRSGGTGADRKWAAQQSDAGRQWALVLRFDGLTPHAVVCLGEPVGVGTLLAQAPLLDTVYLICRREHMQPASKTLNLPAPHHMVRMVLPPEKFRPVPKGGVVRLTMDRIDDLKGLYAMEPSAANAFAPYQLADGVFFGIESDGRLVSAAGTHLIAPTERIGAVGNIFTHPAHRGRGYAAACTSAVCAEVLSQGLTTVLNVGIENAPAIRVYRRLGFEEYCTYYETVGKKIDKEKLDD